MSKDIREEIYKMVDKYARDMAVSGMEIGYNTKAQQSVDELVTKLISKVESAQLQLLSEIEVALPKNIKLPDNPMQPRDLNRSSQIIARNDVLGQVRTILATKRGEIEK